MKALKERLKKPDDEDLTNQWTDRNASEKLLAQPTNDTKTSSSNIEAGNINPAFTSDNSLPETTSA